MKRPSYKAAIEWLTGNTCCEWLDADVPHAPIEVCLVADLFGKSTFVVERDMRMAIAKADKLAARICGVVLEDAVWPCTDGVS